MIELGELRLHQLLDRRLVSHDKALFGETVFRVLKQLSKGNAEAPWVRLVGLEALYQNACNLLLDTFFGDVIIEVENHPRVEICVAVNVSKLINNGVQEAHTSLRG